MAQYDRVVRIDTDSYTWSIKSVDNGDDSVYWLVQIWKNTKLVHSTTVGYLLTAKKEANNFLQSEASKHDFVKINHPDAQPIKHDPIDWKQVAHLDMQREQREDTSE